MTDSRAMFGRKVIYTDYERIDASNVIEVLGKSVYRHNFNAADIQYLYRYYRGDQPILKREKDVRPEINHKVVENRANEIVSFKTGYLIGEPISYVNRTNTQSASEAINRLNEFVFAEDKAAKDKEIVDWMHICGTAYRMVLPDKNAGVEDDEAPFEIYTLDPRFTFVVYNSGLGHKPVMGVKYVITEEHGIRYSIYTEREYFEIVDGQITKHETHGLGAIPIIEYPANEARLGAFEIVMPMLDAINDISSNRLDGVEQFIQSLLVFKGVDISTDDFSHLRDMGGIKVPADGDVSYLIQELNQTSTQTLADNMYDNVLTICGMPNRNGGSSTSDTGTAVIMRDGWSAAEARAKDTELMFKKSEKSFLKLTLYIMNTLRDMNLKLSDIEIRFTRRNYENIEAKASVLLSMLSTDKIHPRLAFEHSGMFVDPEVAYAVSKEYYDERQKELEDELNEQATAVDVNEDAPESEQVTDDEDSNER